MDRSHSNQEQAAGSSGEEGGELRALTFLAPGIPLELFQRVTEHLGRRLGLRIRLDAVSQSSGPMHGDHDPFGAGDADLGFLCSPSYLYLRSLERPSVQLVPAGFAFRDERARGQAVTFSDVVVRAGHPAGDFGDLAGAAWGYNDDCSLSGYFSALQKLAEIGCAWNYFGRCQRTGSHDASIEAILAGTIDAAAIDSTVLARARRERPELSQELRVVESWGPFPVQPIVVRSTLGPDWPARIAQTLLDLHTEPCAFDGLRALGLERCVPIDDQAYAEERRALRALGQIPSHEGECSR